MPTFKYVVRVKTFVDAPDLKTAKATIKEKITDLGIEESKRRVGTSDTLTWELGPPELTKVPNS